ncbi:MAG: ABC transporter substrate-binding protein [Treponema sp.]|nr:ABC transporter substrate-binding protein [Treponema sp.]
MKKILSKKAMKMHLIRIALLTAILFLPGIATSCRGTDENSIIIYTSTEDFRTEHIQLLLREKFPEYRITVQVLSTGNHAARLRAEGTQTEADIILNLETGHLEALLDVLADLSGFDLSPFLPELIPPSRRFLPWDKSSGAIVIDRSRLESLALPVPTSYSDLLNPIYRGHISMPSPRTSGTGYMFLISLINILGEEAAFAYFDSFAENVLQFTTSGSGPVNALIQGEAAIALGMTLTAVNAINTRGIPLEIIFFDEGAPNITTGFGIIRGRETRPIVREVFEFIMSDVVREDKELFSPEPIMVNQINTVPNYPRAIPYADMEGVYDLDLKERLLARWRF